MKWPISFISLLFWKLSCTIHCVQLKYIYIFLLSESLLPPCLYVISIQGECSEAHCCCSGLYGFCSVLFLCDKLIFKKQKTTTKTTTTVYRLKKKITAFYTTEILSQDFAKQELGSSYFFAVDGEPSGFSS